MVATYNFGSVYSENQKTAYTCTPGNPKVFAKR